MCVCVNGGQYYLHYLHYLHLLHPLTLLTLLTLRAMQATIRAHSHRLQYATPPAAASGTLPATFREARDAFDITMERLARRASSASEIGRGLALQVRMQSQTCFPLCYL